MHPLNLPGQVQLTELIQKIQAPLVCVRYGASWCEACKSVTPLYQALAHQSSGRVACFDVDADASEALAVSANITQLPTFVFYTTKLASTPGQLEVLENVIGPDEAKLREFFGQAVQIANNYFQQQQQPQHPVQPQVPQVQQPQVQQPQQPQAVPPNPNAVVKQELLEIRKSLLMALQRTENLFKALQ